MKKWFIVAYIITVLLISGFAKANTEVLLSSAHYDENTLSLSISGLLNGSCGTSLETNVVDTQATEDGPVVILEVKNKSNKYCDFSKLSINEFDITVDLKTVIQNKISGDFYVAFNNAFTHTFDPIFEVRLPDSAVVGNKHNTNLIRGTLETNERGQFILIQANGSKVILKSQIDLNKYLNKTVLIDALEITPISGPGFELEKQDPLHVVQGEKNKGNVKVFVLGISSTY